MNTAAPLILLTRPRRESRLAAAALQARGFEVLRAPLQSTRVAPISAALERDLIWASEAKIHIFVSRAAVRATAMRAANSLRHGDQYLAVGRGCASALALRGLPCAVAPEGAEDSDGLLGLPCLQQVAGQRIAIWAAPGGRERMALVLKERGADVRIVAVYRRRPERPAAQVQRQLRIQGKRMVLTATSAALLSALDSVLRRAQLPCLRKRPLIVASERIAAIARKTGYADVHTADGASTEALIEVLEHLPQ